MNNITKMDRIKYMIVGFISFLCIPASMLSVIFKPLYNKVYYGQSNDLFKYGIALVLSIIFFILIQTVLKKKINISYNKPKEVLPLWKEILVFVITFGIIFGISAYLGFNVKIFYDLGKSTTGLLIICMAVRSVYYVFMCLFIVLIIENFQYALEGLIHFKNPKINDYLPFGGICALVLYGTYALIADIGTLKILFFFLILVYGEIYLLTNRNFVKTYGAVALIFLL